MHGRQGRVPRESLDMSLLHYLYSCSYHYYMEVKEPNSSRYIAKNLPEVRAHKQDQCACMLDQIVKYVYCNVLSKAWSFIIVTPFYEGSK